MAQTDQMEKEDQKPNITAYLQAPRKKRKNYVVIALSENIDADLQDQIDSFIKKNYNQFAVSHPRTVKDLSKQFGRNISLLIIDDKFENLGAVINAVSMLKLKTRRDPTPVIFLTSSPNKLIKAYQEKLSVYQESDDYCDLVKLSPAQVIGRIKVGVEARNRRRSRRYKIDMKIRIFDLRSNKEYDARLMDLSTHGALLRANDVDLFKLGDQIRLSIPSCGYLDIAEGEFLRLTARVRRVYVGGNTAAVSFAHLSEIQSGKLVKFLTRFARQQLVL